MKYKPLNEIRQVADVIPLGPNAGKMSRRERLEQWAQALERHDGAIKPLMRIEYMRSQERMALSGAGTPLAVAYADPVLRAEGLKSERYGDAVAFFNLNEHEAHYLLCDCHYGGRMTPARVAERARSIANRASLRDLWLRLRDAVMLR